MTPRATIAAIALIGTIAPAAAQPSAVLTTRELTAICTNHEHSDTMACNAYMEGFLGGASWVRLFTKDTPAVRFCLPKDGITIRRVVTIFLDHAERQPDKLDEPAHIGLYADLVKEYPCKLRRKGAGTDQE